MGKFNFIVWLGESWVNLGLILVGLSAFLIYYNQKRQEQKNAAIIITLQIEEIKAKIQELEHFIVDNTINETAFYEALPVIVENHWGKYKHLFVGTIATVDYQKISEFYKIVEGINEEQSLIKQLQKNNSFICQQSLAQCETSMILECLNSAYINSSNIGELLDKTKESGIPQEEQNILKGLASAVLPQNMSDDLFWKLYKPRQQNYINVFNRKAYTSYIPVQPKDTLKKHFIDYHHINIDANSGVKKIRKISKIS